MRGCHAALAWKCFSAPPRSGRPVAAAERKGHVMRKAWFLALSSITLLQLPALAEDSLVRFEGGIGVVPVSSVAGPQNANGTFSAVNRNDVRGVAPGGQPWTI